MKKLIYIILLLVIADSLDAQFAAALMKGGFSRLDNDSAVLVPVESLRGELQWQKSTDSASWTDIEATFPGDTLAFIPEATEIYRLVITEGTCLPRFSDSILVFSRSTTVADYLSYGIPVAALYDEGVLVGTLEQGGADSADLADAGLTGTVSDFDNYNYKWVKIGDQVWMAENLRTTKYNDGTDIPHMTDSLEWCTTALPAYCWYDNDSAEYANPYGALYNWYAVDTGILCPSGWHSPTNAEWDTLVSFLGGSDTAGAKLKEAGAEHWYPPNDDATNASGFTGLGGGSRNHDAEFNWIHNSGLYWTADSFLTHWAHYWVMYFSNSMVLNNNRQRTSGLTVRCIKD